MLPIRAFVCDVSERIWVGTLESRRIDKGVPSWAWRRDAIDGYTVLPTHFSHFPFCHVLFVLRTRLIQINNSVLLDPVFCLAPFFALRTIGTGRESGALVEEASR